MIKFKQLSPQATLPTRGSDYSAGLDLAYCGPDFEPYEKPAYIQDKIELNVSEENWDSFCDEYEESLALFPIVSNVVKSRPQSKVAAIRSKVRSTYLSLSGDFECRLAELVSVMAKDKVRDDYYAHNMRVVMLYFFEQCLYGKKPSSEVSCD